MYFDFFRAFNPEGSGGVMPLPAMWKWTGRAFHRAENGHGFSARHVAGDVQSSIPSDPVLFAGSAGGCLTNPKMSRGISGH